MKMWALFFVDSPTCNRISCGAGNAAHCTVMDSKERAERWLLREKKKHDCSIWWVDEVEVDDGVPVVDYEP